MAFEGGRASFEARPPMVEYNNTVGAGSHLRMRAVAHSIHAYSRAVGLR